MKCQAIIEAFNECGVQRYGPQRITIPVSRACKFNAKSKLGSLRLCDRHLKLAVEGMIDSDGTVASKLDIRIARDHPKKYPNGLYRWASSLTVEALGC